ncbi:SDR family oxidoreductase [Virgisporangium aurantiacum]|uniref:Putative NAD-dependent epimerase/dehydratase n=1 Tax=Virgisporangium aurantiacum TaxID=175570 RepID=A0A8J3ZBF9_9ACTN|nr:SDR family oxidoreductase [Virgisporangium aurantiacum]GIJ60899.1 putative NAD-dependent epimerase/dehydratase [Virgisporangium aurantiacum]
MRIFVTGASGWIGSAVVPELQRAGHKVLGFARSDAAAARVAGLGADVHHGDLADLDALRAGAAATDGVVHLGYNHDFSNMAGAAQTDRTAIDAFGEVLAGTDRPLVVAAGTVGLARGRVATEADVPDLAIHPRGANALAALALADRGVRASVVRFAPTVHGAGDHGFVATLVGIARDTGVSAYVGVGANRWPAVHRSDAAVLVRHAVESAPPGTVLHATAEDGVPTREIAEAIGRGLNLPVAPAPADHFGWLGMFFAADVPASSAITRAAFDWTPTGPGLIADLDAGHYF